MSVQQEVYYSGEVLTDKVFKAKITKEGKYFTMDTISNGDISKVFYY